MEPGTFDWHLLKNTDPYPGGEYAPVRVAGGGEYARVRVAWTALQEGSTFRCVWRVELPLRGKNGGIKGGVMSRTLNRP
jgi:hypothetical protein